MNFFCQSKTMIGIINPLMSLLHDNVLHAYIDCYLSSILSVLTNGVGTDNKCVFLFFGQF